MGVLCHGFKATQTSTSSWTLPAWSLLKDCRLSDVSYNSYSVQAIAYVYAACLCARMSMCVYIYIYTFTYSSI